MHTNTSVSVGAKADSRHPLDQELAEPGILLHLAHEERVLDGGMVCYPLSTSP